MQDRISSQDEAAVVVAAQTGSADDFARLVELYDQRLLYFVRRLMGEEAGAYDILQIVWLSVYRRLGKLRSPEAFRAWVYRIAHDCTVSELRRRGKRLEVSMDAQPESVLTEDRTDETGFEQIELVHRGLQELSFEHLRVLALKFLEDMTIEQIAEVIGIESGTVKSRLHYAKSALRRWIEAQIS